MVHRKKHKKVKKTGIKKKVNKLVKTVRGITGTFNRFQALALNSVDIYNTGSYTSNFASCQPYPVVLTTAAGVPSLGTSQGIRFHVKNYFFNCIQSMVTSNYNGTPAQTDDLIGFTNRYVLVKCKDNAIPYMTYANGTPDTISTSLLPLADNATNLPDMAVLMKLNIMTAGKQGRWKVLKDFCVTTNSNNPEKRFRISYTPKGDDIMSMAPVGGVYKPNGNFVALLIISEKGQANGTSGRPDMFVTVCHGCDFLSAGA